MRDRIAQGSLYKLQGLIHQAGRDLLVLKKDCVPMYKARIETFGDEPGGKILGDGFGFWNKWGRRKCSPLVVCKPAVGEHAV